MTKTEPETFSLKKLRGLASAAPPCISIVLPGGASLLDLARGPGRLAQAMRITFRQDGLDLCAAGPLWLATSRRKTGAIGKSERIGLTRNVDRKLRFYERGNPYVSGPKRLNE